MEIRARWPYKPRYTNVNGWRMHYIDEGEGDPVVLLHGEPTWGFLYRNIPALVASGRGVVVPDIIAFALSEKPTREHAHCLDGHTTNLTVLLCQLDLTRIIPVCHDWGGPTGRSFAISNQARVRALTIISTWARPLPPAEFHTRIFRWRMMHASLVGPCLLGNRRALAGGDGYLSVVDRKQFAGPAQGAYESVLPDPATRLLTWVWPRWIPLGESARAYDRFIWLEQELSQSRLPTLIIWGREDEVFDATTFSNRFEQMLPHAEGPPPAIGRHFLPEDSAPRSPD